MRTPDARRSDGGRPGFAHRQRSTNREGRKSADGPTRRDKRESSDAQQERNDNLATFRFRMAHGVDGTVHQLPRYKRNGKWQVSTDPWFVPDFVDELERQRERVRERREALRFRRRKEALLERYRQEGRCTPKQLEVIEALLVKGLTQAQCARMLKVTPAAISLLVAGLKEKAPEFYKWCAKRNQKWHEAAKNAHARRRKTSR